MKYFSNNGYYHPYESFTFDHIIYGLPSFDGYNLDVNCFIDHINCRIPYIPPDFHVEFIEILINNYLKGDAQDIASQYKYNNYIDFLDLLIFYFDPSNLIRFQDYGTDLIESLDEVQLKGVEEINELHYRISKIINRIRNKLLEHTNFNRRIYDQLIGTLKERSLEIFYESLPTQIKLRLPCQFRDLDDLRLKAITAQNLINNHNIVSFLLLVKSKNNFLLSELLRKNSNKDKWAEAEVTPDSNLHTHFPKTFPIEPAPRVITHENNKVTPANKRELNSIPSFCVTILYHQFYHRNYLHRFQQCLTICLAVLVTLRLLFELSKRRESCDLRIGIINTF